MKWAFWSSVAVLAYTFVGYPGWLWLRSRYWPRPVRASAYTPSLSIVMVVRNEAAVLADKLRNLLELDYPLELCELIVVSDGSIDATNDILRQHTGNPRIRIVLNSNCRGKADGLNDAIAIARGEMIIFTDARQKIEPGALQLLVQNFADPTVGCVSGELMLGDPGFGEVVRGMGLYWRIEKMIREMESACGSVVGATGAFYAIRRNLLVPIPTGTILDDVYIPMHVVRQGFRVIFVPSARAWDVAGQGTMREFSRKVRTLTGNYQLVQLAPWLLTSANPIRFEFISHKLMRLIVPGALIAILAGCSLLPGTFYQVALWFQLLLYGLAALAVADLRLGPLNRISEAAQTFVVLNMAAVVAFANFVTGRKPAWLR